MRPSAPSINWPCAPPRMRGSAAPQGPPLKSPVHSPVLSGSPSHSNCSCRVPRHPDPVGPVGQSRAHAAPPHPLPPPLTLSPPCSLIPPRPRSPSLISDLISIIHLGQPIQPRIHQSACASRRHRHLPQPPRRPRPRQRLRPLLRQLRCRRCLPRRLPHPQLPAEPLRRGRALRLLHPRLRAPPRRGAPRRSGPTRRCHLRLLSLITSCFPSRDPRHARASSISSPPAFHGAKRLLTIRLVQILFPGAAISSSPPGASASSTATAASSSRTPRPWPGTSP